MASSCDVDLRPRGRASSAAAPRSATPRAETLRWRSASPPRPPAPRRQRSAPSPPALLPPSRWWAYSGSPHAADPLEDLKKIHSMSPLAFIQLLAYLPVRSSPEDEMVTTLRVNIMNAAALMSGNTFYDTVEGLVTTIAATATTLKTTAVESKMRFRPLSPTKPDNAIKESAFRMKLKHPEVVQPILVEFVDKQIGNMGALNGWLVMEGDALVYYKPRKRHAAEVCRYERTLLEMLCVANKQPRVVLREVVGTKQYDFVHESCDDSRRAICGFAAWLVHKVATGIKPGGKFSAA